MDDFYLAITGKAYINKPLTPDTEYEVITRVTTYGENARSNQDGTKAITFKARIDDRVVLTAGDQVVVNKEKKPVSPSQKWRYKVMKEGADYDVLMQWQLQPEVANRIIDWFFSERYK